jgi:hypothetical protein
MATVQESVEVDGQKLEQFVFRAVDEVGATLNAALVVIGDKLGLYRALAGAGGLTPIEVARRASVSERYVREWLNAQAAGGYLDYDPAGGTYTLPPEQAIALTDESSPAFLPGFFQIALGTVMDSPRITEAGAKVADIGCGHGSSTILCTPASLSQDVGLALGAQAGEARIGDVVSAGGLTRFRRAAETPFNLVFEARL